MTENNGNKVTLVDKWLNEIKNHPVSAIIILIAAIIIGFGSFTDSVGKLLKFFNGEDKNVYSSQETLWLAEFRSCVNISDMFTELHSYKENKGAIDWVSRMLPCNVERNLLNIYKFDHCEGMRDSDWYFAISTSYESCNQYIQVDFQMGRDWARLQKNDLRKYISTGTFK